MADKDESLERMAADDEVKHYAAERVEFEKQAREWRATAKRYTERYRNDGDSAKKNHRYSILWANTEILKASTFNRVPKPDVSRRWQMPDDQGQEVAQRTAIVMEKALQFGADDKKRFARPINQSNQDAWIGGLGQIRVKVEQKLQPFDDGSERSVDQRAPLDYVYWDSFRWSPARTWNDVWWVEYDHLMTRDDMRANPATREHANDIPLTVTVSAGHVSARTDDKDHSEPPSSIGRALIRERWDKRREKRIWLADGWKNVLLKEDPPASFDGFFDCPEPLVYFRTNDIYMPLPHYGFYEALAIELDDVTERLAGLTSMAKACGAYDQVMKEFNDIADLPDGVFIPLSQGAGSDKAIKDKVFLWPVDMVVTAIVQLSARQAQLRQIIDDVTGISDIIRGQTSPSETLGAQQLKAQFGDFRLSSPQDEMQRFVEDAVKLQGEVTAEVFEQDTLARISGEQVDGEMMELMRDEQMRSYRVSVSLDELVQPDEEAQKQRGIEYLGAMQSFFAEALPTIQAFPQMAPLIGAMVKFANRLFNAGRELEEQVDETMDALAQQASQPQEPPGPSPDVVAKEEGASKREMAKAMTAMQLKEMELDASGRSQMAKAATDLELEDARGANRGNGQA